MVRRASAPVVWCYPLRVSAVVWCYPLRVSQQSCGSTEGGAGSETAPSGAAASPHCLAARGWSLPAHCPQRVTRAPEAV